MGSTTCFDFRQPQFSDEFTWLPDWLQQNQSQRPGDEEESEQPLEVVPLSTRIGDGGYLEDLPENDEARCADFQLFLSGEDSSPINFSPYPVRVNHFSLRLSFTGPSQRSESQATDEAEAVVRLSKDFPVEKIRSTAQPSAKTSAQGNSCRKSGRHVKDGDLDASVELSIVASEAVVIHELAESEPALRCLPMESVLEIAMRVKEARLQKIDDASDVLLEDTCADDSLMDLDDLTMLDAFQDVGLPIVVHDESEFCDADISQVQETPVAELHKMIDCEYECLDIRRRTCGSSGPSDSLTELALEEQSKEKFPLESLSFQMVQDVSKELPSKGSLLLPREKGMDAAVLEKRDLAKCIPKLFVCETSFLSESADVSQNQNSVAQKPGTYIGATSEVNVFLHDSYYVANNCIRFSQEVVGSSSTPLADPLCSVVPCSIPNEINDTLELPASRLSVENSSDSKSLFGSGSGNLYKTTQERNELAKDSMEPEEDCHNQTGFRRSFLSLKTFSVLPSNCETKLENTRFVPILPGYSGLIPPVDFLKYNRRLTGKLCAEGATAVASVKDDRFNNIEHSTGKIMHTKSISGECMKDAADLLLCEKQERKLSLITDDRKIHLSPQAFDLSRVCSQRNEDTLVLTPPNALKVCLRKTFPQMKLQHNYFKIRQVPGRKRVRFSGVDMELPVGRHSGNISNAENKCTLKRSAKRMKHFNCLVDHPPHDMKNLGRVISNDGTPSLFDGIEFLLAGFSRCCEKEIEILIHKHGGVVIFDVPSTITRGKSTSNVVFKHWLVVISPKKLKTTKFLYGCAVGALLLKLSWIMDSIAAGSTLPPENYWILSNRRDAVIMDKAKSFHHSNAGRIFSKVGFVLHGKRRFFMKFAKVIKHGGGEAYGNLHELIQRLDGGKVFTGIIVTEYDKRPSRHLHQCATERKIVMMHGRFFKELPHFIVKACPILSLVYGKSWESRLEAKELQANFVHLSHLSKYYKRAYSELFLIYEAKVGNETDGANTSNKGSNYQRFGWLLFLALRVHAFSRIKNIVTCMNGLVSILVIMMVHMPARFRNFSLSDSSRFVRRSDNGVDLIASLCKIYETSEDEVKKTLEQANNLISAILKKKPSIASGCKLENLQDIDSDDLIYFEDLMDESSLSSILSCLEKDYEDAVRCNGELDERVFLNEEDSLLGSGTLSGGAINMTGTKRKFDAFSSPSKTITSPLSPFRSPSANVNGTVGGSNSIRLATATPVSTAMTTAKWLRTVVSPLPSEPSAELKKFLASCDKDVTDDVIRRVHVILEVIFPNTVVSERSTTGDLQSANLMDNIWAEQRRLEAMKLYYRVLEAMCRAEAQILHSNNLTSLLMNDRFHRCMLSCSAEVVLATHKTVTMLFPTVLERTGITAFDLSKVIESLVRYEESLPRELRRHLNTLEERLLERMVWEMYNSLIVAKPVLAAEINRLSLLAEPMPSLDAISMHTSYSSGGLTQSALQKHDTSGQNGDIRSPKRTCVDYRSGLVERNFFTSPVKDCLLAFSCMKSKLPPPPLQSAFASPTRPHPGGGGETCAETGINILFTKITKLAAVRISGMLERLQLSQQMKERVYSLFQQILNQRTSLFFNRHIDQIILCCFYGVAKISQTSLTFKEIINNYRKQPHCKPQVFRNVFVDWSSTPWREKSGQDHVGIITFYNEMFVPSVKPLLVELSPGKSLRSNCVTEIGSNNDAQCPGSPKISAFPNLLYMSPKKISASHNVYLSPLRSSKIDASISHSSRSYYACVGESTHAYQSPSKDLTAINDRLSGNRRVRGTLNFDVNAGGLVSDSVVANSVCLQIGIPAVTERPV